MTMANPIKISVAVEAARASSVAAALRGAGVTVDEVLEDIGTITGSCPEDVVDSLSALPGVLNVELQGTIELPSPGSSVQ